MLQKEVKISYKVRMGLHHIDEDDHEGKPIYLLDRIVELPEFEIRDCKCLTLHRQNAISLLKKLTINELVEFIIEWELKGNFSIEWKAQEKQDSE